jgi:hypothetical protein
MLDIKKNIIKLIDLLVLLKLHLNLFHYYVLWNCAPFSSTLLVVILLIQGTVPLGTIWIIKSIIKSHSVLQISLF